MGGMEGKREGVGCHMILNLLGNIQKAYLDTLKSLIPNETGTMSLLINLVFFFEH